MPFPEPNGAPGGQHRPRQVSPATSEAPCPGFAGVAPHPERTACGLGREGPPWLAACCRARGIRSARKGPGSLLSYVSAEVKQKNQV